MSSARNPGQRTCYQSVTWARTQASPLPRHRRLLDISASRFSLRLRFPMKKSALLFQFGALCASIFFVATTSPLRAQVAPENVPAKPLAPEDFGQGELLKSYLQVREQLHAAQLAI